MTICSVPTNQPIYQALIDKAGSYPADKVYQIKAYNKAAEYVATMKKSIYEQLDKVYGYWLDVPFYSGIGIKIANFIEDFIKANPLPSATSKVMDIPDVQRAFDGLRSAVGLEPTDEPKRKTVAERIAIAEAYYHEYIKTPVYTAENPRRSKRNIGKPPVKYFDEEGEQDDDTNGDDDETYVDEEEEEEEQDEVTRVIKSVCAKNQWPYSDDLVTDYKDWYATTPSYLKQTYHFDTESYIPARTDIVFKRWAKIYSTQLKGYYRTTSMKNALIRYCNRHGYKHNETLAKKFLEWASDPANTTCVCTYADNVRRVYDYPPTTIVTNWFKTLQKTIIF